MASKTPKSIKYFANAETARSENKEVLQNFKDSFWDSTAVKDILPNWNQLFPYQLLIMTNGANQREGATVFQVLDENPTPGVRGGGGSQLPAFNITARFTLPIPPQALSISTPFAINTSVSMGGIIEEHNGAPLRMISIQGTTGVLPLKGTVAEIPSLERETTSILAGTVTGIRSVTTATASPINPATGRAELKNLNSSQDVLLQQGTGFAQFHLLRRFLEQYVTAKKQGANLFLGLAVWKEKEVYFVTPKAFELARQAARPQEYPYSIQFISWRRILSDRVGGIGDRISSPYSGHIGAANPTKFSQIVNGIETSRRILEGSRRTLQGFRSDIQRTLYTPLRETVAFAKDAAGIALAVADLPGDLIRDLEEPILEIAAANRSISRLEQIDIRASTNVNNSIKRVREAFKTLSLESSKAETASGRQKTLAQKDDIDNSGTGRTTKILKNAGANFDFFSGIQISSLSIRPVISAKIEQEKRKVRNLTRLDFEIRRDATIRLLSELAEATGAGNEVYSTTFDLPTTATTRVPTEIEWRAMYALSALAQQYDSLSASGLINPNTVTAVDYVAGLATRSGIAFTVPRSKFAVPFPYGYTLEQLARDYLGTPDRWHEIATLNGLRSPYVDETGFTLPLLANGLGRQFVVGNTENLYVGQKIWLSSQNTKRESRRITNIVRLNGTQLSIEVDGESNLQKFTVSATAVVQAFKPGTVNSQQQIYIPSDQEPSSQDFRVKDIPGVNYFDKLLDSSGIDLLLTSSNDLVITSEGDTRLAVGLNAIIQRIRVALGTVKGSLLHHPEYGVGLIPGTSTAELDAQEIKQSLESLFRNDPALTGISDVSVAKYANSLKVRAMVGIAATGQFIPLQFDYQL